MYAKHFGLHAIAWLILPTLLLVAYLAWGSHSVPHRHEGAHDDHAALPAAVRRARWVAVALLYAGNAVRFTVNMALVQLIIRWSEHEALLRQAATTLDDGARTLASTINGPMQAAMQAGMGIAGFAAGLFVRSHHEKLALVVVPAVGALAVAAFPFSHGALAFALAIGCGVAYAGVIPVTISLAQRLLPHRTGLASGLMMGGAWSLAAVGPPGAQWLYASFGIERAFLIVAALLVAGGLLGLLLPGAALRGLEARR
jgi:MFS family permease